MKQALYGWTDYPIAELGDRSGETAPIRSCAINGYDGDKYCSVSVGGVKTTIKRGYLYPKRGRCGDVACFSHKAVSRLGPAQFPS